MQADTTPPFPMTENGSLRRPSGYNTNGCEENRNSSTKLFRIRTNVMWGKELIRFGESDYQGRSSYGAKSLYVGSNTIVSVTLGCQSDTKSCSIPASYETILKYRGNEEIRKK